MSKIFREIKDNISINKVNEIHKINFTAHKIKTLSIQIGILSHINNNFIQLNSN